VRPSQLPCIVVALWPCPTYPVQLGLSAVGVSQVPVASLVPCLFKWNLVYSAFFVLLQQAPVLLNWPCIVLVSLYVKRYLSAVGRNGENRRVRRQSLIS